MARTVSRAKNSSADQVSQGEASFRELEASLLAIKASNHAQPNVDLQDAGLATLALVERLSKGDFPKRLKSQAQVGEFDDKILERAKKRAWAAVHIRRKLVLSTEIKSEARVPEAVVLDAQTVRTRMLRVVEYHFDDHPELAGVIAHIREGSGYLDLANDLEELAEIYREQHATLRTDHKRFRATDEAQARKLAADIYKALGYGSGDAERDWNALQAAIWPLIVADYNELRRVGLYLSREDESLWPTLVSAARNARKPATAKSEEPKPTEAPKPTPA